MVRAVERDLDGTLDQAYTHLVSLDAANAFNAIDQTTPFAERQIAPKLDWTAPWTHGERSDLLVGELTPRIVARRPTRRPEWRAASERH